MYYILEVTPMIFAEHVKNKFSSLIHEMATAPWLFSKNPEVD
ncbi:IS4/IS5 family transposase, partial [Mediterraneibacter gnavus]